MAVVLAIALHLRIVVLLPIVLFVIALGVRVVVPLGYRSESRVYPPPSGAAGSRFAGIAAQFGVSLGGLGGSSDPLALYDELLGAQEILRTVLLSEHVDPERIESGVADGRRLLDILSSPGGDSTQRMQRGVEQLRRRIEVTVNKDAGTIRIRVIMPERVLAERVNRLLLSTVNAAAVEMHRSKAERERVFIEERMSMARRELDAADVRVIAFYSKNRQVPAGSTIEVELSRLQREAGLRKEVFVALAQSYEQARIEEVRNTPVFSIIDAPESTAVPRGRTRDSLIWIMIGFVLAVSYSVGVEAWRRQGVVAPEAIQTLRLSWKSAVRGFLAKRNAAEGE